MVELDLAAEDAPIPASGIAPPSRGEPEPAAEAPPRRRQPSPKAAVSPNAERAAVQTEPQAEPGGPEERKVLEALAADGSYVDEIAEVCRIPVSEALSTLTLLELKGLVRQFSGKRFAPR
ncbi:MAG: hypothetical protein ACLFU6_13230 [Candidatus Hydrogenedentota bacterium]